MDRVNKRAGISFGTVDVAQVEGEHEKNAAASYFGPGSLPSACAVSASTRRRQH
jgi:hypothetical protein